MGTRCCKTRPTGSQYCAFALFVVPFERSMGWTISGVDDVHDKGAVAIKRTIAFRLTRRVCTGKCRTDKSETLKREISIVRSKCGHSLVVENGTVRTSAMADDLPTNLTGRAAVAPWKRSLRWRESEQRFRVRFRPIDARSHRSVPHTLEPSCDRPLFASHFRHV